MLSPSYVFPSENAKKSKRRPSFSDDEFQSEGEEQEEFDDNPTDSSTYVLSHSEDSVSSDFPSDPWYFTDTLSRLVDYCQWENNEIPPSLRKFL